MDGIVLILVTIGVVVVFLYCLYVLSSSDPFGKSAIGAAGFAERALGEGDVDTALDWADRAIEADPNFYPAYRVRGRAWEMKGEFHEAIEDFTKLSAFDSDGYVERGRTYEKLGRLDMAARDYCRAIENKVVSRNSATLFSIARAFPHYTTDGAAVDDTIAFFAKAIKRDPDNARLRQCQFRYLHAVGANDVLTETGND